MKLIHPFLLILVALQFSACSKDQSSASTTSAEEKPKGILTEAQTKTLDKAKAMDETLKQAEAARRKQMEEAEQ